VSTLLEANQHLVVVEGDERSGVDEVAEDVTDFAVT